MASFWVGISSLWEQHLNSFNTNGVPKNGYTTKFIEDHKCRSSNDD